MKNKIIFIPGWMQTVESYRLYQGLDIWGEKIDYYSEISTDYVVAHSLGTIVALLNWQKNKNTKLILVNPPVPQRNIFVWIWRWIKYNFEEEIRADRKIVKGFWKKTKGLFVFESLLKMDIWPMLGEIPKDNIWVIRGKRDYFFCDEEACQYIKEKGVRIIEVDAGHDWNEKFDQEIEKIIQN
jgi:hypothetical protein